MVNIALTIKPGIVKGGTAVGLPWDKLGITKAAWYDMPDAEREAQILRWREASRPVAKKVG
ncbi:hypothetical protein MUP01_00730 [Candidatus Bathyarchaeota archaeon]|nr:hypothetical protein [Candidatus Bathyarchaeota archaeon]